MATTGLSRGPRAYNKCFYGFQESVETWAVWMVSQNSFWSLSNSSCHRSALSPAGPGPRTGRRRSAAPKRGRIPASADASPTRVRQRDTCALRVASPPLRHRKPRSPARFAPASCVTKDAEPCCIKSVLYQIMMHHTHHRPRVSPRPPAMLVDVPGPGDPPPSSP